MTGDAADNPADDTTDWQAAAELLGRIQKKWGCERHSCPDMADLARCACAREWQSALHPTGENP